MANLSLIEQLDEAVEAIIANPDAPLPQADGEIAPLLRVAVALRHLPRPEFKTRLKADLAATKPAAEKAPPASTTFKTTATAYLSIRDAAAAIEFYKKAFGATELMRLSGPGDKISHACIQIGGASIMLADEFPEAGFLSPQAVGGSPVRILLDVEDVDALAKQAVAAGATEVRPVKDQFYGVRSGQFADPFGFTWIISMRTEELTFEEMQKRFDAITKQSTEQPRAVTAVDTIRQGFRTVTPYLVVKEVEQVIDFVQSVFGAEGRIFGTGSEGGIHSEYKVGDSMLMIGGGSNLRHPPMPAAMHLYVEDVDAVYQRAMVAGGTSLYAPTDHEYGERGAAIKDAGGNHWYLATAQGSTYVPEGSDNLMPYLHPRGAPRMIEFLKQAFGAEEIAVYQSPDGIVHHAKIRIGNSIVEMGEAHEQWQPMPSMFMLYVDDADAWYAHAMKAEGAISMGEPKDQPYGDRVGAVKDPFDNLWYIGTPIKDAPR